jgi:hypothetical protein
MILIDIVSFARKIAAAASQTPTLGGPQHSAIASDAY